MSELSERTEGDVDVDPIAIADLRTGLLALGWRDTPMIECIADISLTKTDDNGAVYTLTAGSWAGFVELLAQADDDIEQPVQLHRPIVREALALVDRLFVQPPAPTTGATGDEQ